MRLLKQRNRQWYKVIKKQIINALIINNSNWIGHNNLINFYTNLKMINNLSLLMEILAVMKPISNLLLKYTNGHFLIKTNKNNNNN